MHLGCSIYLMLLARKHQIELHLISSVMASVLVRGKVVVILLFQKHCGR